jgi:pyridinium-3,5-biscarboxylic acid mononucleotide sulfurtransferase
MSELAPALAEKRDQLLAILRSYGRVAVAYSGGVDSAVVAKAAQLACGDKAVAVTAVSASLASGEREAAAKLAAQIGIRHRVIETREFENPDYLKNAPNRCYFCKTELYTRLEQLLDRPASGGISDLGLEFDVLVNGANLDDRGDYRPGMTAAREHAVRSPLIEAGLSKSEVRELAAHWNLPVWDKPATPCLSSRIAYGLAVTPERVQRVDEAEKFLREEFGLREFRVRHEMGDLARIEVPLAELPRLTAPPARELITQRLRKLGFKFVTLDLDGFRSGSMNAVVPLESLVAARSSSSGKN